MDHLAAAMPRRQDDKEMNSLDLEGKVAVVTGANRGIGRGCALELARRGARVAVNFRTHAAEADAVAHEVKELGSRAVVVQGDVGVRADCERLVKETVRAFGRVDILVANAAYTVRRPFLELAAEDWHRVLDVTLSGVFHTSQLACRQMVEQGAGGSVIAISSVHAVLAFKNSIAYNASKAALNHMTRTMANELAPHRIRVNVIEPGWTDTPGELEFTTPEQLREQGKLLPLGRLGTIEDMGKAAVFLASDDASYVTGAVLRVDGGFVLPRPGL
jgi:glucose 1-dehydrogenase